MSSDLGAALEHLTPLGVMVLALLREGDLHPYEMLRVMRQRRDDRLARVTNGTLYHTVARLQRHDLLVEVCVERHGRRPERTTYRLTPDGLAIVPQWVRRELHRIDHPEQFRVALAEAHNLDLEEATRLLQLRRDGLSAKLDTQLAERHVASADHVPEYYLVELDREQALLEAELRWLDELLQRLRTGALLWGDQASTPPADRAAFARRVTHS